MDCRVNGKMKRDSHDIKEKRAYRNNKSNMSNIQFAREVFSFIVAHPRCSIRVGDFEHFFDTLNHVYLKI